MSRLSKRLAGPAFYINVKFDQATASKNKQDSSATMQRNNPRLCHHVVNESELFDIKEGEILYCCKSTARDGFARVLSSLNGTNVNRGKMKFIGIAQTEHKYDKKLNIDQGLVACVSGVVTVLNESDGAIHPGDLLVLGNPKHGATQHGIPHQKMRFIFERESPTVQTDTDREIEDVIRNAGNPPPDVLIELMQNALRAVRPRYIAKALSYAKKGERLDILLHPRQT
jgi:hypothetical protein